MAYFLKVGLQTYRVETLAEASAIYFRERDRKLMSSAGGASNFPDVAVKDETGKVVGWLSHGGKVWPPGERVAGGALFDPFIERLTSPMVARFVER